MTQNVAVFWDIVSCPPLHTGYRVAEKIRNFACAYGNVTTVKGYWSSNAPGQDPISKDQNYRNELQISGVMLIDCAFIEGIGTASVSPLITDILLHAVDSSSPTTIIIISGAGSLIYPLSMLRLRNYHLIAVLPSSVDCHVGFKAVASEVRDWHLDVLKHQSPLAKYPSLDQVNVFPHARTFYENNWPQHSKPTPNIKYLDLSADPANSQVVTALPGKIHLEKSAKSLTTQSLHLTQEEHYTSLHAYENEAPVDFATMKLSHIPDILKPLVTVLRNLYTEGYKMSLRSMVGEKLSTQYRDVYKNAGVAGFSAYIALAEKEHLVQLGGIAGKAWVILHPDLRPEST